MMHLIVKKEADPDLPQYWSSQWGWVSELEYADFYTDAEKARVVVPVSGKFKQVETDDEKFACKHQRGRS